MDDLRETIEEYDQSNYLDDLRGFPDQVREGVREGRETQLDRTDYDQILVCGMGGSGITGDLLSQFLFYQSTVPIQTNRFYRVPTWVDERTLVVVVSYSGNTEETLSACEDALRCDADCLAVTSNGELTEVAEREDFAHIEVPQGMQPRAAAAYLFVPLPFVLGPAVGYDVPDEGTVETACNHLEDLVEQLDPGRLPNPALTMARQLEGRLPILYGSEEVTAVLAQRFKNQINENAKTFAVSNVLPEMNHNEVMAIDDLEKTPEKYGVVFLRDRGEHARIQKRFTILEELLEDSVGYLGSVESRGRSLLARFLTLMLHTDYVSYYLALLNERDPTSIGYIDELKQRL
jgi:glucose/mannose-6-phosphate isomerase